MSDDLQLNSLDRFRKQSERLVLEEHGHCEVPAGCGGAVLRWLNPNSGVPVVCYTGFADNVEIFVDENRAASGRLIVPYGEHVLAVHVTFKEVPLLQFWIAGRVDAPQRNSEEDHTIASLTSTDDGTWRATFIEPEAPQWQTSDFDDSDWIPLEAGTIDEESVERSLQWRHQRMLRYAATPLDLTGHPQVWIRKRFLMEH